MLSKFFSRASTTSKPYEDIERLKAQIEALKLERHFWAEQARGLQNQLQSVMRSQGDMFEQMARGGMINADVRKCVSIVSEQLRVPLTSVEATAALVSSIKEGTQGCYTSVMQDVHKALK